MTAGLPSDPLPAATVALLRPSPGGPPEVLLTKRPSTMSFGPDLHVFPGGRIDAADADARLTGRSVLAPADAARALGGNLEPAAALAAHVAALRELFEEAGLLLSDPTVPPERLEPARNALLEGTAAFGDVVEALGVTLRTDRLVPIGHWTTPPIMPRRFDTWFFAAAIPSASAAELSFDPREVVAHRWLTPRAGLDAMADGEIDLWLPTSATLQQLEHATDIETLRRRLVFGPVAAPRVIAEGQGIRRLVLSMAGGVPGQTVNAYVVGDRERVVIDPGDASDAAADAILEAATRDGGRLVAIALTHVDPDHAAGAEALALRFDLPILGGPAAGRDAGFDVRELRDGDPLPGDGGCAALEAPGPRPDHLAFIDAAGNAIVGDLVGGRGSRSIVGPPDDRWDASHARVAAAARRLLPGHGDPVAADSAAVRPAGTPRGS